MDTAEDGGRVRLRGPSIGHFVAAGRAGAQFLSNPRRTKTNGHLSEQRWTCFGCTCPLGVTACFQTLPDLLCSRPSFYTLPWTLSCNHNGSPIFSIRASVVCLLWPSVAEKKKQTVSTLNGTFCSPPTHRSESLFTWCTRSPPCLCAHCIAVAGILVL